MSAYLIADVTVKDDSWLPDYATNVHDIVSRHGGKYLARSANITTMEGPETDTSIIALIEFPSVDAAQAFAADPDYAPFAEARSAGSLSHFRVIDSTDAAGTIPYLDKPE